MLDPKLCAPLKYSTFVMAAPGVAYLVYTMAGEPVELDLTRETGEFSLSWLDSASGELQPAPHGVTTGKMVTLAPPTAETKRPWVAWLARASR